MKHDNHVNAYDTYIFMKYRIAAKKRNDIALTFWLKFSINCKYATFRELRLSLFRYYPDYFKEAAT